MPIWEASNFLEPGSCLVNGRRQHLLGPKQFSVMQNMKPSAGNIIKRGGVVTQGSSLAGATVRWLTHAYDTAGANLVVREALCGTQKYYKIGAGAWTAFGAAGLTAGTYPVSVPYKDYTWWCDGVNTAVKITTANPPVATAWSGLPSGINPTWVVLHKNSLYYGGDLTSPQLVYFTDPGAPETTQVTNFYQVPDDQNGNFPKIAVNCFDGIALVCQDFIDYLTGTGANTHRIFAYPRGAACTAWRSVVDMGKYGMFYLTENGVCAFDGHSDPEPLDAYNAINVADIDLTTETDTWAMRVGDEYRLYYKSKGSLLTSVATAAAILASSTSVTRMSWSARPFMTLTSIPFVAAGNTDHYYSYNAKLKLWSGPHTGTHACGAWTQYRSGDTQDPWVGDATTGGLVSMADQLSAFLDNGNVYECYLRTGAIGNFLSKIKVSRIKGCWLVGNSAEAKMRISVWQNGDIQEPPTAECWVAMDKNSSPGGANAYNPPMGWQDFVIVDEIPNYNGQSEGYQAQIEYRLASQEGAEFRGHELTYEEIE